MTKFADSWLFCITTQIFFLFSCVIFCSCDSHSEQSKDFAKFIVIYSAQQEGHIFCEIGTLSNYTVSNDGMSYSIKQIKKDPQGGLLAPSMVWIDGKRPQIEQCGTYQITINDHGIITRLDDFAYHGERRLFVARGPRWSMFICRDDWKMTDDK